MSAAPKITVLFPVYNSAEFLRTAIDSILAQIFTDFEFLIIDDGSTDESASIISSYTDPRIRVLKNEKNSGLIFTLNRGIKEARGKYIARMDADDISLPDRLQMLFQKLESDSSLDAVASFVDFINTDGEVTGVWNTDRSAVSAEEIRQLMMRTNCIAHPTVMMKAGLAKKFLYNEKQKGAEDWDLWMRMLAAGHKIAKVPVALLRYRVHAASITASDKREEVLEKRLLRVKRKFLWSQFLRLRLNSFFWGVKISALKNIARHIVSNKFPDWARDIKRILTSPPWTVMAQGKKFREALSRYNGKHFFIFPYTHVGGAEIVHADIVAAVKDRNPLVIFSGFSQNDHFLSRFTISATALDVSHYVNYPFTRRKAKRLLSDKINSAHGIMFGCNAGLFYDIIPSLNSNVNVVDLIHAFKYQPEANFAHRKLLPLAGKIHQRIFVSGAAADEFRKFSFHNNISLAVRNRIKVITNSVDVPASVETELHAKPGILFVGRNSPEKRYNLFVKIAMILTGKYPGKFSFRSVGVKDVNANIQSYGELFDSTAMQKVYQENDILLLTSSREGFPMVIMEAMANGLVVISTPVGDVPNRLNGSNGIVLTACEDETKVETECLEVIESLIQDPQRMQRIRIAAHAYALEHYSPERFRKEYREVLNAD